MILIERDKVIQAVWDSTELGTKTKANVVRIINSQVQYESDCGHKAAGTQSNQTMPSFEEWQLQQGHRKYKDRHHL